MHYPAHSPNVNPIEPVWHEIKTIIRHLPHPPSTVEQLKVAVHKAWDDLTIEQITKYTGTMVDQVQAVKKARGGHTGY